MMTPDKKISLKIEQVLDEAGWSVQCFSEMRQASISHLIIRDFPLARDYGLIDYLLGIDGKTVGLIEVINEDEQLSGISVQSEKYSRGLPFSLRLYTRPLPFLYQTNGHEICFTNAFDPEPKARILNGFHRPETLQAWLEDGAVGETPRDMAAAYFPEHRRRGRTFHERVLINMPDFGIKGLSEGEIKAVQNLEDCLKENRRRILIALPKGPKRRTTMCLFVDRLLRFVDARRILILFDQEKDLGGFVNVLQNMIDGDQFSFCTQILNKDNTIDLDARLCIATAEVFDCLMKEKAWASLPIETFEVIILDECLELSLRTKYFDAYMIGFFERVNQEIRRFFDEKVFDCDQQKDGLNVIPRISH